MNAAQIKPSKVGIFRYFVAHYRWQTVAMLALQFLLALLEGLGILALLPLINIVINSPGGDVSYIEQSIITFLSHLGLELNLSNTLLFIAGIFALKAAVKYFATLYVVHLTAKFVFDFRMKLLNALLYSNWGFYTQRPVGSFINALMTEAQRSGSCFKSLTDIIAAFIQMLVLLFIAASASLELVGLGVFTCVLLWFVLYRFIRISGETGQQQKDFSKTLSARIADILGNYKPLKAMHAEKNVFQNIRGDISQLFAVAKRQMMAKQNMNIFHEPVFVLLMCCGLYIALAHLDIDSAVLMMLAAVFYRLVIAGKLFQQAYQVLTGQESFFWSLLETIHQAEDAREAITEDARSFTLESSIALESVSFSYGEGAVLNDLDLVLPARNLIGVVGASGSGKTTVIDLISGLYRPEQGRILLDEKDMTDIGIANWRRSLGYVPQEFVLLNDTLKNNITLGDKNISEDAVIEALKLAEAWAFVKDLPDGLETNLGERGGRLSGGQRQRISIARALVRKPTVLILDEATAALDPETEAGMFKTLKKLSKNVTIIAISHQAMLREQADILIDLEKITKPKQ